MAIGSRRVTPTLPLAAAVVSEAIEAPIRTPWVQSRASSTSGISEARRPPKTMAEIGTPWAASASGDQLGHCVAENGEARIGVCGRPVGRIVGAPLPICFGLAGKTRPPGFLVAGQRHIGENGIVTEHGQRVGIGGLAGARRHAEVAPLPG